MRAALPIALFGALVSTAWADGVSSPNSPPNIGAKVGVSFPAPTVGGGGGSYVGDGDLAITPTWVAYWGLRCFTKNSIKNVADLSDHASHTATLKCDGAGNVVTAAGNTFDPASVCPASTAASPACWISKLYDQVAAIDVSQATAANQPVLSIANGSTTCGANTSFMTAGAGSSKFCASFNGSTQYLAATNGPVAATTFTFFMVSNRATGTSNQVVLSGGGTSGQPYIGFRAQANVMNAVNGSILPSASTLTDQVWHAASGSFGTGGVLYSDATTASGSTGTVATLTGANPINIGRLTTGGGFLNGYFISAGVLTSASNISSSDASSLYTNEKTWGGF